MATARSLQIPTASTGFSHGHSLKALGEDPLPLQVLGEASERLLRTLPMMHHSMLFCMELFIGFPVGGKTVFIHSFNFETEKFHTLPPPGYFRPIEKQFKELLKLGVVDGCLFSCVCGDDTSQFDMWVMKDYGVQESWMKTLVVEGLYLPELDNDVYEPLVFLRNGEILLCYNDWIVVCYNQGTKSLRETRVAQTGSHFRAIGYNPSFVSLQEVAKGEKVKRSCTLAFVM
ncbi:hypothetical protein M0R45_020780 [Rubus argutus]|uniref:F-box associated beta-propeller type 1 domain-containing protein n=1 Tax=Rubus argutus TaxID=59490 RepID=A0AAW1XB63_RUBAR